MANTPAVRPLVSFIVPSCNYEQYVGLTLQSILDQTVRDFEVIVVDDASTDNSRGVVLSFTDPRIRLHVNDRKFGLVKTYNRGLELARGEYISYLDSDDYIEPLKIEKQLDYFRRNPKAEIVGSYVKVIDKDGNRHPSAEEIESLYNKPYDFNDSRTWTTWNKLVACSVVLRRSTHERVGPRDATMAIGADYEYWTRAHAQGCVFGMVEEPLFVLRRHSRSASARDTLATAIEVSYLLQKNIVPVLQAASRTDLIAEMIDWHETQPEFIALEPAQRYRILGLLLGSRILDCAEYRDACLNSRSPELLELGRSFQEKFSNRPKYEDMRVESGALVPSIEAGLSETFRQIAKPLRTIGAALRRQVSSLSL
jgi:GT2 family glycosyltransferase